jgi:hypothetical protein
VVTALTPTPLKENSPVSMNIAINDGELIILFNVFGDISSSYLKAVAIKKIGLQQVVNCDRLPFTFSPLCVFLTDNIPLLHFGMTSLLIHAQYRNFTFLGRS